MSSLRRLVLVALALSLVGASCRKRAGGETETESESETESETETETETEIETGGDNAVHGRAAAFFATQPSYFQPLADTRPPGGLEAMDSATCGACHPDQLAEWRDSIHARAWDDDQYQAELTKDPGIRWICINCHLPLYDQQPRLPVGLTDGDLRQPILVDNPRHDETLRDDAIGCAACHVREGWVEGPTGQAADAPHRTRASESLTTPGFCTRCHGVEVYVDQLDMVCAFATGREWEAWRAAQPEGAETRCQDCHMPDVSHRRWVGAEPASGSHHAFPGSLIPKRPADAAAFDELRSIFPEGVEMAVAHTPGSPGGDGQVRITLTNANAGHAVPTGDPERYLELHATVHAGGAQVAGRSEVIRATFEWHPKPKLLSDNRLAPGEARTFSLPYSAPAGDPTVRVEAELHKYRIEESALQYHHLEGEVVPGRLSSRLEWTSAPAP